MMKGLKAKISLFDWNEAPEWANYAALDENGKGYWLEHKPSIICRGIHDARRIPQDSV